VIAFEIPYPATKRGKAAWNKRFGLNAYYAGKHWSQRKKDAEEMHELAHWAMRKAGITKRLVNHPVKVTFFWNDNLDIDNHGALGKAILDALNGHAYNDDSAIALLTVRKYQTTGASRVEVIIEEEK
jgi:Holliday junction resolvase RusA-like endonuclease